MRLARLVLLGCLFLNPTSLKAQETIVGVWRVISVETKEIGSDNVAKPFGEHLNATFIFTVGGHMAAVITAGDRKAPTGPNPTDAERAELHRTLSAYSGTYRVEASKLIMSIKNSSIQSWNGTDRILTLEFKGKTVTGTATPFKSAVSGKDVVAVTTWERVE